METIIPNDLRLIEKGFPCHQVGAETQRERDTGKAPPPNRLHVWWARRPLTPSRAAILASLLPADTDPDWFLRQLGIEKHVLEINGQQWTIVGKILEKIEKDDNGKEFLPVDDGVLRLLSKEQERRSENIQTIARLKISNDSLANDPVLLRWESESQPIPQPWPEVGEHQVVEAVAADPAWAKERIESENSHGIRTQENKYGYDRAYSVAVNSYSNTQFTVLDPTAGGGSIPFEALRLGHKVIANELNPVATVILHATLEYPAKYGPELGSDIQHWGNILRNKMIEAIVDLFPASELVNEELSRLNQYLNKYPELINGYSKETLDGFLYCRQVTCPNCGSEAPLLNTCWLSKEAGSQWGVRIITDGHPQNGKVRFETYRAVKGKGPKGDDPDMATVNRGVGTCVHCRQAIDAEEIKCQARGESSLGKWKDRLYCVVAVRFQPKLDSKGKPICYKSGVKAGKIKTEKVRFFRSPNQKDLDALVEAEKRLMDNWDRWEAAGLIPTESIPLGHKTKEPLRVGMNRWCDMFTPRQLLGHLTLVEELNRLKPLIIDELGFEKGRAVVTYLQFAIDKGVDYNSRQTRWIAQRGQISGSFGRHDFSLKWTFGEMIFTGPQSGAAWGLSQIVDAYKGISALSFNDSSSLNNSLKSVVQIINGTAGYMPDVPSKSVDLVCMDPPYYNNVQYAELSDFYYVWQKRTLKDLYCFFNRRLTNKQDEAVANPDRDGGSTEAKISYERIMGEIFNECYRVTKDSGLMTLMFTHKSQDAWEALTQSLIQHRWIITSAFPVESEFANSQHLMDNASASSSIFLTCRKRIIESTNPALWTGIGGTGVAQKIRDAVTDGLKEFEILKLNPVDEMVASYGRALRVLSQSWPVLDGDEPVGPIRAMNEASRVVSQNHIRRVTGGRLKVEDLTPEAAMALTLFGIFGLSTFSFDEALNLSKSLNIRLENKGGGYTAEGQFIGINTQASGTGRRSAHAQGEDTGFHAPLVRKGSSLRLARPGERHSRRLESPQNEWDLLHGLIMAFRTGDVPVARGYLHRHAQSKEDFFKDLLNIWAAEVADEKLKKEAQALIFGLK
jgi:putative DNA methylase